VQAEQPSGVAVVTRNDVFNVAVILHDLGHNAFDVNAVVHYCSLNGKNFTGRFNNLDSSIIVGMMIGANP
jgi:hypothetical protein